MKTVYRERDSGMLSRETQEPHKMWKVKAT